MKWEEGEERGRSFMYKRNKSGPRIDPCASYSIPFKSSRGGFKITVFFFRGTHMSSMSFPCQKKKKKKKNPFALIITGQPSFNHPNIDFLKKCF